MSPVSQKNNRSILYIDDDEAHGVLIKRHLKRMEYDVDLAQCGTDGLEMMRAGNYDLVLLDYHLPDYNCSDLIARLLEDTAFPIIVISAADAAGQAVETIHQGAADYLVKTADNSHLRILDASLKRALAQHQKVIAKKAAEEALYNQRTILRNVLDNIPHSVYWKNLNSIYQGCNMNFARSAELRNPDDIIGKSDEDMPWRNEAALFREGDRMVIQNGPRLNQEITYLHGDGLESTYLSSSLPLMDSMQKMRGIVSIFVDITDRKRTEEKLVQHSKELEEKNHQLEIKNEEIVRAQEQLIAQEKMASLGTMAAGIAHEIRNPLNFIQNLSSLSASHALEIKEILTPLEGKIGPELWEEISLLLEDISQNATVISRHGERAGRIVRSMMDLASGGTSQFVACPINSLVEEYVNLLYKGNRSATKVEVVVSLDPLLGHHQVVPQNIGRVIINLLNNAVDATFSRKEKEPKHKPKIHVRTSDEKDTFAIKVQDNGPGIPKDIRDKIFHPFFTTKPTGAGNSGLGLSISYDIVVNEHKGEFLVNTKDGEYTEFVLRLPK